MYWALTDHPGNAAGGECDDLAAAGHDCHEFPGHHRMKEMIDVRDASTTNRQLESLPDSNILNDTDGAIAIM